MNSKYTHVGNIYTSHYLMPLYSPLKCDTDSDIQHAKSLPHD